MLCSHFCLKRGSAQTPCVGRLALPQEEGSFLAARELMLEQLVLSYCKCKSKQDRGSPRLALPAEEGRLEGGGECSAEI